MRSYIADKLETWARMIRPKRRIFVCAARPDHIFEDPDPKKSFKSGILCPSCKELGYTLVGVCHPEIYEIS